MKQTAVEQLAELLRFANKEVYAEMYDYIEQLKGIERQQIADAWWDGVENWDNESTAEQYYNETFNTNEK